MVSSRFRVMTAALGDVVTVVRARSDPEIGKAHFDVPMTPETATVDPPPFN